MSGDRSSTGCESLPAAPSDVVAIGKQYPLLWERAVTADTGERLGQSVDPLDAECDAVLREIWMARKWVESRRESTPTDVEFYGR